jgi:hypothetical protein
MVAGLNAQLRTVRRGSLRSSLMPVVNWLNTHANVELSPQGVRVDLAWYQATASGYYQIGLLLNAADEVPAPMPVLEMPSPTTSPRSTNYTHVDQEDLFRPPPQWQFTRGYSQLGSSRRRIGGAVLDAVSLRSLEYRRDPLFPLSLIFRNSRPVGHQVCKINPPSLKYMWVVLYLFLHWVAWLVSFSSCSSSQMSLGLMKKVGCTLSLVD